MAKKTGTMAKVGKSLRAAAGAVAEAAGTYVVEPVGEALGLVKPANKPPGEAGREEVGDGPHPHRQRRQGSAQGGGEAGGEEGARAQVAQAASDTCLRVAAGAAAVTRHGPRRASSSCQRA